MFLRLGGNGAAVAFALGLSACSPPAVEARAVWSVERADAAGRDVFVYDRGEIERLQLGLAGEETIATVTLEGEGRGVMLTSMTRTHYYDLVDGRRLDLDVPGLALQSVQGLGVWQTSLFRTRNGRDFGFIDSQLPVERWIRIVATHASQPRAYEFGPPSAPDQGKAWQLHSAAAAPVIALVEFNRSDARTEGRIRMLRYPGAGSEASSVEILGDGNITSGASYLLDDRVSPLSWCGRGCMTPSGSAIYVTSPTHVCQVVQWRWADADIAPAGVEKWLPSRCFDAAATPTLFAAIDDDVLLYDDGSSIHAFDVATDSVRSVPIVGRHPELLMTDRGRVAIVLYRDGPVLRIDAKRMGYLTASHDACGLRGRAVVSPRGHWVAWTCGSDGQLGGIVRVSALGVERYASNEMQALVIDDDGNMLLYSADLQRTVFDEAAAIAGTPYALFVLTAEGEVSRVHDLEPEPLTGILLPRDPYFDATGLR